MLYFATVEEANDYINQNLSAVYSMLFSNEPPRHGGRAIRCINPAHSDKHPSMYYYEAMGKKPRLKCMSCGVLYDSFDLIKEVLHVEGKELFKKAYEMFQIKITGEKQYENTKKQQNNIVLPKEYEVLQNIRRLPVEPISNERITPSEDLSEIFDRCNKYCLNNKRLLEHYQKRGFDAALIGKKKLGAIPEYNMLIKNQGDKVKEDINKLYTYIIPYNDNYFIAEINDRSKIDEYNGKYRKMKNITAPIYNEQILSKNIKNKIIFITEGVYDCLSIEMVSEFEGIALNGVGYHAFKEKIKLIADNLKYNNVGFVIALDNDEAGETNAVKIQRLLKALGLPFVKAEDYDYKDFNDFLVKDKSGFADYIQKQYQSLQIEIINIANTITFNDLPKKDIIAKEAKDIKNNYDFLTECGFIYFLLTSDCNYCYSKSREAGIDPTYFSNTLHKIIFTTIGKLVTNNDYVDQFILSGEIEKTLGKDYSEHINEYYEKAFKYMGNLPEERREKAFMTYIEKMKENLIKKKILSCAVNLLKMGREFATTEELKEAVKKINQEVLLLDTTLEEEDDIDTANNFFDRQPGTVEGLNTGLTTLDAKIDGLKEGNLIVIAGRPAMGKTAFAGCIAENTANYYNQKDIKQKGGKVLFLSLEMTKSEMLLRSIARNYQLPLEEIRKQKFLNNEQAIQKLDKIKDLVYNKLPVEYHTPKNRNFENIRTLIIMKVKTDNVKVVVIDHMQLLQTTDGTFSNRSLEIAYMSKCLKQLAVDLKINIILLAQLNRKLEGRDSKKPVMSDLRDSGGIEENADVVALLYREYYYNRDQIPEDLSPQEVEKIKRKAELIIEKNRHGETGIIPLMFYGETYTFVEGGKDE